MDSRSTDRNGKGDGPEGASLGDLASRDLRSSIGSSAPRPNGSGGDDDPLCWRESLTSWSTNPSTASPGRRSRGVPPLQESSSALTGGPPRAGRYFATRPRPRQAGQGIPPEASKA